MRATKEEVRRKEKKTRGDNRLVKRREREQFVEFGERKAGQECKKTKKNVVKRRLSSPLHKKNPQDRKKENEKKQARPNSGTVCNLGRSNEICVKKGEGGGNGKEKFVCSNV